LLRASFRIRVDAGELLDDPEVPLEDIRDTLHDQALVNRWLKGGEATLAHALPMLQYCTSTPVRVLDIGCGGADLSRRMVDEARRLGKRIEVTALDLSAKVLECAQELAIDYPEITFVQADALDPPVPSGTFDIVMVSTLLHHLQPEQVVCLLRLAGESSRGHVVAADLVRSPWAYWGFWFFARLALLHPMSIHDGGLSIRRAYTPAELADLAQQAGLANWTVHRHRLYRMALVYTGTGR